MYRLEHGQMTIYDFVHPFGGSLNSENRWVKMSEFIPWSEFELKYAKKMPAMVGNVAKPFRMALGALLIQQIMKISDEETVQQITENIYLQFFVGLNEFSQKTPFDQSLMTHFRKRITIEMLNEINEEIYLRKKLGRDGKNNDDNIDNNGGSRDKAVSETEVAKKPENHGKILLDATCAPADVRYPTDLSLLNEARELLDTMIDHAHAPLVGIISRPRTQRRNSRKLALSILKKKNPGKNKIRAAIRKILECVKRNLRELEQIGGIAGAASLSGKQENQLEIIKTLYQQQQEMFNEKKHSVADRIVSIHQPHVRPIVRGKVAAKVEFGAKVEASLVNGYTFLDICSWDARNESITLKETVEKYCRLHGHYPEAILADQIYRTRDNRAFCKERSIRLSGPALGRPKAEEKNEQMKMAREDSAERNAIEGKFGEGKRKYGMNRIMARLKATSESVIGLQFLVMNLKHLLRVFCDLFWLRYFLLKNSNCRTPVLYST